MKEILVNLIAALIFCVLGAVATKVYQYYQLRFRKEYSKFTYYRVIRLRFQDRGDKPYYVRHHHMRGDVSEPVFDEAWCLNSAHCNQKEILEDIHLSTSGLLDAIEIMPVLGNNTDNHPHTRDKNNTFTCSHAEPSTHLTAVGTMVNGLQQEDQWWYGTTAQYDNQTLLLIVDFTSLPFEVNPVSNVTSQLERSGGIVSKHVIESQWFENHIGSGLYYLKFKNARKGDVIKFTFFINKQMVPVVKTQHEVYEAPSVGKALPRVHG